MKTKITLKSTFFIVAVLIAVFAHSQNTYPDKGNVGIGTKNPGSPLTIVSGSSKYEFGTAVKNYFQAKVENTATSGDGYSAFRAVTNATIVGTLATYLSTDPTLLYGVARGGWSAIFHSKGNGLMIGTQESDPLLFGTNNIERMRIDAAGKVGIGETSPNELLEIASAGSAGGRMIVSNGANASRKGLLITSSTPTQNYTRIESYNYGAKTGIPLVINNIGGGNVGIGTATPASKLEVYNGDIRISNDAAPATLTLYGDRANSGDKGTVDARIAIRTDNSITEGWNIEALNYAGAGKLQFNYSKTGSVKNIISIGDGTIEGQNNVGIGTSTPGQKLQVQGNILATGKVFIGSGIDYPKISKYALAVKGTAIADKIVVQLYPNWPDYVFTKEYKILSLSNTETYIKTYGHLPDVPSASEVEKDGINLGDNQVILLKKIEELTLFAIEQNKRLEEQSKKIAELEMSFKKLQEIKK